MKKLTQFGAIALVAFCAQATVLTAQTATNATPSGQIAPPASPKLANKLATTTAPVVDATQTTLAPIVVTASAPATTEGGAIDQQHDAVNLITTLSKERIEETGAKTAAEAAVQLPGVSAFHDQGEPRAIQIRGVAQKYNSVTYDGFELPSSSDNGDSGRGVSIDNFGAGLIGSLVLTESPFADQTAQGLGGQLDIVPNSAFNYEKASSGKGNQFDSMHSEFDLGAGMSSLHNDPMAHGSGQWSNIFKIADDVKLGVLFTGGVEHKHTDIEDLETDYNNASGDIASVAVADYSMRRYLETRTRGDLGANFELKISDTSRYFLNGYYTGYDQNVESSQFRPDVSGTPGVANLDGAGAGGALVRLNNYNYQFRDFGVFSGGNNKLDNDIVLDYSGGFASSNYYQSQWNRYNFKPTVATGNVNYQTSGNGDDPSIQVDPELLNSANYTLKNGDTDHVDKTTQSLFGQESVKIPASIDGHEGYLKFGTTARESTEVYYDTFLAYFNPTSSINLAGVSQNGGAPQSFYNSQLTLPAVGDFGRVASAIANTPGAQDTSLAALSSGSYPGYYKVNETVGTGYGLYNIELNKLTVSIGARVEGTGEYIENYTDLGGSVNDSSGNDTSWAKTHYANESVNFLPSLHLKYDITPKLVAHLDYSKTIARQNLNELGSGRVDTHSNDGAGNEIFTVGNPNLKAARSHNIDASIEWFPMDASKLVLGGFDKEVSDYSVGALIPAAAGQVSQTYINIDHSRIYGVQGDYEQQFTFLPGLLSGLGFAGNVCLTSSLGQDHPGKAATALPGQVPLTWNLGAFYRKYNWDFSINSSYSSAFVEQSLVGVDPTGDNYADEYLTLNCKLGYHIDKNFFIYAEGINLNDEPLRYYQGDTNHPIQKEYYRPSFNTGLKITF